MGTSWLRVAAWLVAIAAVVGNLAVMVVLLSSLFRMTVGKLLMVNLAAADLCMGLYLLLIAAMDLHTIGVYFNFAIDWQNGIGCKAAGFLTVFASQLSIFTLVVITCERWYTITYAIHLNRRLRLSTTAKIMTVGWTYALTMATLPLVGISGFSTTSICLPLENRDIGDTVYLTLLLVMNGVAFIMICLCYGHMYHSISGHNAALASHSDATVAKRMALLVFTDFACWAPIAFFGLTAVAGYPLIDVTHSKILLVFFYPLNAFTNPYLYALLTKQYRRDFFLLVSRYGYCTQRATRYKAAFSVGWNNARRPGCHSPSAVIRRSSGMTAATSLDSCLLHPVTSTINGVIHNEDHNNQCHIMVQEIYSAVEDNHSTAANGKHECCSPSKKNTLGSPHPMKNCHIRSFRTLSNGDSVCVENQGHAC